jgi:hypothetical protein
MGDAVAWTCLQPEASTWPVFSALLPRLVDSFTILYHSALPDFSLFTDPFSCMPVFSIPARHLPIKLI